MFTLETDRLILVQTPLEVLQKRLERDTFVATVELPGGRMQVTFTAEWPGEALELFPAMIEQHRGGEGSIPWGGTVIERKGCVAVGQIGFKGLPADGVVEIGYGINPSYQNRGYATEMVTELAEWALSQPTVHRVTAECRIDNVGSIRVLEKAGFERIGERFDEEDGPLIVWQRVDQG